MHRIPRVFLIIIVVFFPIFIPKQIKTQENELLSPKEASEMLKKEKDKIILLDIRRPEEYETGYIKNAKNIDYYGKDFKKELEKLDKDKDVMIYCQTGRRSAAAAVMMRKAGFKKVYDLKGGIEAWEMDDRPIEEDLLKVD